MTGISEQRNAAPRSTQEQQPELPGLSVPDSSFRRVLHVVSDAGPLIQTLESGIPTSRALIDGLLKIPLARWTLAYSSEGSRASTRMEASSNSSGSQPFTVRLTRSQDFWGGERKLDLPYTKYEGSISYSLGGGESCVSLASFPDLLKEVFDTLESRVQEPAVRDSRRASIEGPAGTYAADMEWTNLRLARHEEGERGYLPRNLREFLDSIARREIAQWKTTDPGDSYEYHGIDHAWLYTFDNGESLALARVKVSFIDRYDNNLGIVATSLIVGSRGTPSHCFHLLLDHECNPSEFHHQIWRLTRPSKGES